MDDLLQEIDRRCILIGSLISSCCVWKRTEFCLTERNLQYSYMHKHPFCDQVKQQCGLSICQKNDTDLLIRKLPLYNNQPFIHKCHAGACELVIPVHRTGRLLGCILCGPFGTAGTPHPLLTPWREKMKTTLPELVELLLTDLLERYYNRYPEYKKLDKRIADAMNYIAANYSRRLTLEEVAAVIYLSPSRFSHLFRTECGVDFSSYLRKLRIMVAHDMLLQTHLSISEISLLTGFASQQHFTTMYRKMTGKTPAYYRKNSRSQADKNN